MKTIDKYSFWQKLNRSPINVYLRYQGYISSKYGGKWIRGFEIGKKGVINLILE